MQCDPLANAIEAVKQSFKKGMEEWSWEELVLDVMQNKVSRSELETREGVLAAARLLRREYPHSDGGYKKLVEEMKEWTSKDWTDRFVTPIEDEYARVDGLGSDDYSNSVWLQSEILAKELDNYLPEFRDRPKQEWEKGMFKTVKDGVIYGLYLSESSRLPSYIGESGTGLESRIQMHTTRWWKQNPVFVTYITAPELNNMKIRKFVEKHLIEAISPAGN